MNVIKSPDRNLLLKKKHKEQELCGKKTVLISGDYVPDEMPCMSPYAQLAVRNLGLKNESWADMTFGEKRLCAFFSCCYSAEYIFIEDADKGLECDLQSLLWYMARNYDKTQIIVSIERPPVFEVVEKLYDGEETWYEKIDCDRWREKYGREYPAINPYYALAVVPGIGRIPIPFFFEQEEYAGLGETKLLTKHNDNTKKYIEMSWMLPDWVAGWVKEWVWVENDG